MRPALEEIKTLEAFIAGALPEENRQEIEIRLLWDQDLQQKLGLQQIAYRSLREAGRAQLRQELKSIHARLFPA
ncbi:hypothetical protein AAE02nite_25020 [Adhaeribacter aerolatus]|uniref:Uncharacterized protein n=1 Tax=Adhaeribacter aerolatus TaxID=670289 RepID=A0A512AYP7_9BACT|nr:hypothetical protein [Adhaeribacter aerolatus]GEO04838.1 hypothetical protein AAE02nite_25020 [Adhaeribacter aerolatus]